MPWSNVSYFSVLKRSSGIELRGKTVKPIQCIHHYHWATDLSLFRCICITYSTSESVLVMNSLFIRIAGIALSETAVVIAKALIILRKMLIGLINRTCVCGTTINKQKKP